MAAPLPEHVRNIALVGQDGAGKTSLAEAMLYVSGRTSRMGSTDEENSYLDYDEEEMRRHFTISASIAPVPYKDYKINLIDTSGHPDFLGETIGTMFAAEMAMFVVDAVDGPGVMTTKLWNQASKMKISQSVYINHIDRDNADFNTSMALLHARFGKRLSPVTLPIGQESDFKGIVDIVRMKARYFGADETSEHVEEIPADYIDQAQIARDNLIDAVVEVNDELMMKYLDGEALTDEELELCIHDAINQGIFVPVYVGSTIVKQGIQGLIEDITTFFPHPREHAAYKLKDNSTIAIDETKEPSFFVFKSAVDPFVGRLSYIKVLQGVIEPGLDIVNARTSKKERISKILVMMGKEANEVKSAKAGDIVVIPKLDDASPSDTFSHDGNLDIESIPFPEPQYPVAIDTESRNDEDKLASYLSKMEEIDPTLHIERNDETHQTVVYAMGDEHVQSLLYHLKLTTNVDAKLVPVRIPYRETITLQAEAQGRHKKQTGGSGQFGECFLRLQPHTDEGYEFINEIKGGAIPTSLIPAVDKGVQEAMQEGFLAGYPMVDISCTVYDGSYHSVDSNEVAFKTAARIAFRACCDKAKPVILEPMVDLRVNVSDNYAGVVMGDITTRRGRIIGTEAAEAGSTIIIMRAPYAEMLNYTRELRALTHGQGSYTLKLKGYEIAPHDVQQRLMAEYAQEHNA